MSLAANFFKRLKNFFYYQRVVLYGYDLSVHHKFEFATGMKRYTATLKDVEQLYNDELNTDLTSIEWELWKDKISNGLWKGFICKDGDSIVAQSFYSIEDIFFGGTKWVVLDLPSNYAYGFKVYVRPDYRGNKLGQAITLFRLKIAKEERIKGIVEAINSNNKIARHNNEKMGGYVIGSVIFLSCRFFNKVFLTSGIAKRGFRLKNIDDF
jgi:GNAT superfamily N-acetyltransferase